MNTGSAPRAVLRRLLCLLCLVAPAGVLAHAVVVSSRPAANAVVDGAKVDIDIEFNSRVDASRSRLSVIGARHQSRALEIDPAAPANRLRATARDLAPGPQLLEWYVLSTDGHITRGRLKFTVRTP
ncbi:MAG: copper resistance CopC family protein [Gammaproteobacteria bacterium]